MILILETESKKRNAERIKPNRKQTTLCDEKRR